MLTLIVSFFPSYSNSVTEFKMQFASSVMEILSPVYDSLVKTGIRVWYSSYRQLIEFC